MYTRNRIVGSNPTLTARSNDKAPSIGALSFLQYAIPKGFAGCARTLRRCTAKHSGIRPVLHRPATLLFRFHPNCRQRKFRRFQTIHQAIGSGNVALRNAKRLVTSHKAKVPSLANTSLGPPLKIRPAAPRFETKAL